MIGLNNKNRLEKLFPLQLKLVKLNRWNEQLLATVGGE